MGVGTDLTSVASVAREQITRLAPKSGLGMHTRSVRPETRATCRPHKRILEPVFRIPELTMRTTHFHLRMSQARRSSVQVATLAYNCRRQRPLQVLDKPPRVNEGESPKIEARNRQISASALQQPP